MQTEAPYRPELQDLYFLHTLITQKKRTTVLEFGCGWSTQVMAHALALNREKYDISHLRRNNPFELHTVDDVEHWIEVAKQRTNDSHVHFYYSPVRMTQWNGRITTEYESLPLVNPDLIYLDGPDQFDVQGDINGITTGHKDMMPMSCDILKVEHFLTPGTIIVTDGRTANARFLKRNLQRSWEYEHQKDGDRHIFTLVEEPLGKHNENQLLFYEQ